MAHLPSGPDARPEASDAQALQMAVDHLTRERDELASERDALLNANYGRWLESIRVEADAYDYQRTFSWRVTQPIRYFEAFVVRARHDGLGSALASVFAWLRGQRSAHPRV